MTENECLRSKVLWTVAAEPDYLPNHQLSLCVVVVSRYTCILYLNDDEWDTARDGGALRIYPGTEHKAWLSSLTNLPFVDVCPGPYGRLLVFDSRAIHSVEPVLRKWGRRRALTLWINRPVNCDLVPGETYF